MSKLKSLMNVKILSIISCAIIVVGMILGTVFHFAANGFFYYGGEYSSYKSVAVNCVKIEENGSEGQLDLKAISDDAFKSEGVSPYSYEVSYFNDPHRQSDRKLTYKFALGTDSEAIQNAVDKINDKIAEVTGQFLGDDLQSSKAEMHEEYAKLGGEHTLSMAAIAIACIIVVHMLYTMIRYRFSAAFAAIVVDLHNLALFAALLAICRVPVTSSVAAFAVVLALVTVVGVTYTFDRIKRNLKDGANEKLTISEITEMSAAQTFKANIALPAFLAIVAVLFYATMAISAMSAVSVLAPALMALVAFVIAVYGDVLFAPAIYCFFKKTGNLIKKSGKSAKKAVKSVEAAADKQ